MNIQIRPIQPADYPVLEDFLYHAIFIPDGEEYPPREVIFEPEILIYIKEFGLDSDCGVVAIDSDNDSKIIGAAWTRIIPAYGHLDENTPELAISMLPEFHGQGVGTTLMNRLFELLRERGYKRTSLSVQKDNPAVRFYKRLGYKITDEKLDHVGHEDYIMVKYLLENTELFSGKAEVYAKARPGYPKEAIDYILSLAPDNAVFADVGAGTGKLTQLLAQNGNKIFAVEPNSDMRKQLAVTLADYPNAKIISASAENTMLPENSVDVIVCAQALHWFEPEKFKAECRRVGKNGIIVIAVYNRPRDEDENKNKFFRGLFTTDLFFKNPTFKKFDNTIFYTREKWNQYMQTHSQSPLPIDSGYDAYIAEANNIFDRDSIDDVLRHDIITIIYSERF